MVIPHDNNCDGADEDDLEQATMRSSESHTAAAKDMRAVQIIRLALITVWVVATVVASSSVFIYTNVCNFVLTIKKSSLVRSTLIEHTLCCFVSCSTLNRMLFKKWYVSSIHTIEPELYYFRCICL
jgi:hypothetical protein